MIEQIANESVSTTSTATPNDTGAPGPVVRELDSAVNDVVRIGAYQELPAADGPHIAIALSHRLQLTIGELQRHGWPRPAIVQRLERARAVHAESPFIRRLQNWPRGYPGDFETIEYLIQQRNRATPGRLSYWLEQYALDSALAQQHRNKADLQARAILETILTAARNNEEPRVLILAAGGSPDLRQIQSLLAVNPFRAVLLDQDGDALAFSKERLPLLSDRLTLVKRNVVRGLHDVRAFGPFHLVLAGGLFDYLPDRVATMVLRHAREHLLVPGGQFMFTNINTDNPYRPWMEHMADWSLIHRSEADVRHLAVEAGYADDVVAIARERTGLTWVAECRHDSGRAA